MRLPENVLEYFRKQGKIGGAKRTEMLTPERRSEVARLAAQARWAKAKEAAKESSKKPASKKSNSDKSNSKKSK